MNPEQLLTHFDRISDAPSAVPRLRQFILDLAVRGKLVEQDPNDEPASELLKRIEGEKARLVKEGKTKKQDSLSPIKAEDIPFALPHSWKWIRIADGFLYDAGIKREPRELLADSWLLELEDIEKDTSVILNRLRVRDRDSLSTKSEFQVGDILYGKLRPYLNKVVVATESGYSTTEIVAIRPYISLCPKYCCLALRRSDFVEYVNRIGQGTKMPRLRTPDALAALFPLPPLAEQHRIVAKVDELMALCDKLETAQKERENRRNQLVKAALSKLSHPDNQITDTRFFLQNLPHLTTHPDHIKQFRQTILDLAVCGKLVEQDPNDEPASELLKRIQGEKALLLEKGIIKKQKPQLPFNKEEIPFILPRQWVWVRLSDITDVQDPNPSHRMPHYVLSGGVPFISSENFVRVDDIDFQIGKQVAQTTLEEQISRFLILDGALAFSRIGTIGKSRFLPVQRTYCLSHALCVINPLDRSALNMRLLRATLEAESILAFAHRGTRSIGVPDLGMAVIRSMSIPLPPLAEQHRIVAKVDELMTLCDKLETRLITTRTDSRRLLEAILDRSI